MAEPLTSTQLENALKMAAKVVETFGDDWGLYYDSDGGEVSCRTDDEGPIEGSYVEVFSTSQWPSDSNHSPVAEFLSVSIVMVPRLVGEVERLNKHIAAYDRLNKVADGGWQEEVDRLKTDKAMLRARLDAAEWTIRQALAQVEHEEAVHVLNRYVAAAEAAQAQTGGASNG